eukprot:4826007-Pyramimonas_sp.AAC.1
MRRKSKLSRRPAKRLSLDAAEGAASDLLVPRRAQLHAVVLLHATQHRHRVHARRHRVVPQIKRQPLPRSRPCLGRREALRLHQMAQVLQRRGGAYAHLGGGERRPPPLWVGAVPPLRQPDGLPPAARVDVPPGGREPGGAGAQQHRSWGHEAGGEGRRPGEHMPRLQETGGAAGQGGE